MTTQTPQDRLLKWPNCLNSRDLGGFALKNGAQTRWNAILRSDSLGQLTPPGQQALLDYGIRTIIDLRFQREAEINPSPFTRSNSLDTVNLALDQDQNLLNPLDQGDPAVAMCDLYSFMLETNRNHVAKVLTAISRARPGGVLFHCQAGKDRTGLISAILLGAACAPAESIAEDYAFTHPLLEQRRQNELNNPSWNAEERRYHHVLATALPETMLLLLRYLEKRYDGVKGYLETTPLKMADLELLLERFVSAPGS